VPWAARSVPPHGSRRGGKDWLLTRLQKKAADARVDVATHLVLDDPAGAVAPAGGRREDDLVVVGSGSAHGARRLAHLPEAVPDLVGCTVPVWRKTTRTAR